MSQRKPSKGLVIAGILTLMFGAGYAIFHSLPPSWNSIVEKSPQNGLGVSQYYQEQVTLYLQRNGDPKAEYLPKGFPSRQQHGFTVLMGAVASGDIKLVRQVLSNPVDVNASQTDGTALHMAVFQGHKEMIDLLIKNGADINSTGNINSTTPKQVALGKGDIETYKLLDKYGAKTGKNDLFMAVFGGVEAIREVLVSGVNIDEPYVVGSQIIGTPLSRAAEYNDLPALELLISAGSDVNHENGLALRIAVFKGHNNIVKELIEHGADVNLPSEEGKTPLELSFFGYLGSSKELALLLLKNRAKPNTVFQNKSTPLTSLWRFLPDLEVGKKLLELGADPNQKDGNGTYPLQTFLSSPTPDKLGMMKLLLEFGANSNQLLNEKDSPLILSIGYGNLEAIRMLLEFEADPNQRSAFFGSPLTYSIDSIRLQGSTKSPHLKIIELLLQNGANPNLIDDKGYSPLNRAILFGKFDAIPLLLKYGADMNLIDPTGKSPLITAQNSRAWKFFPPVTPSPTPFIER